MSADCVHVFKSTLSIICLLYAVFNTPDNKINAEVANLLIFIVVNVSVNLL